MLDGMSLQEYDDIETRLDDINPTSENIVAQIRGRRKNRHFEFALIVQTDVALRQYNTTWTMDGIDLIPITKLVAPSMSMSK